jgi:hypothetical protein
MDLVLHAEDRYNFNPGMADIATGIPDDANGVFEVTGLGAQYTNYATLKRTVTWSGLASGPQIQEPDEGRARQPQDNRRVRNRV